MFAEPGAPHHVPHFHAYYQKDVAVFSFDPVELIAGFLPRRQRRLVEAFPEFLHSGDFPFDPEFPIGPPHFDHRSPEDEVPDDNPRIPHPSTSDQNRDPADIATWRRPL